MSENLKLLKHSSREAQYKNIIPQIQSLIGAESDHIANMANLTAVLKQTFGFLWVGFYIVKKDALVLGPFQGSVACTRILYGKGVCGTAWMENRTIVVPDVNRFEGHIVCDSQSRSEIVIPIRLHKQIIAVLDIDSEFENDFSETDIVCLQQITSIIEKSMLL